MSKKITLFLLLLISLTTTTTMLAQSNPTVEIVLSQPTAQQGDTVTADVYVRNAVNLGGADIGITVDNQCLTVVDRQPGTLLPTTGDKGGFSPFSELHDHDTRLAAAVTDRTKIANGDGVFFHAQLKVTCAKGTALLKVSFAQLASYKDPAAKEIQLVDYKLITGNVTTINAQLVIGPAGQVTGIPTQTLAPVATSAATATSSATQASTITPSATPVPAQVIVVTQDNTALTLALVVMAMIIIILVIVVVLMSRRRKPRD